MNGKDISAIAALDPSQLGGLAQNGQTAQKLEQLKKSSLKDEKDLEKATKGFEAMLLNEMLKSMWDSVETTGLLGEDSNEAQIYRDMFNQAIADTTAEGRGIGLKEYLKRDLERLKKTNQSEHLGAPIDESNEEI